MTRAVDDVRTTLEVKGQMLEDEVRYAHYDTECFQGIQSSCDASAARLPRTKRLAAKRDAAVAAFGRDRDAGIALLNAAVRRLR
jgi:hypothetical protein